MKQQVDSGTAISVGSDSSPDQASRHTPDERCLCVYSTPNSRGIRTRTTPPNCPVHNTFLPEIIQPTYDSEEQERKIKMAVILAELATAKRDGAVEELRRLADEWAAEGLPGSLSIRDRAAELEGKNAV